MKRQESHVRIALSTVLGLFLAVAGTGAEETATDRVWSTESKIVDRTVPRMAFDQGRDFVDWQTNLREQLVKILAVAPVADGPLEFRIERQHDAETDGYTVDRIEFVAEPGEVVPGYLLLPKGRRPPFPVMICLQGHSPGMHISIGRAKADRDRASMKGGRDLAVQAVARGWAAIAVEQRGFGERAESGVACRDASLRALHCGRPMTGGRVLDVMRTIDFIRFQSYLDDDRIACMGNSAGGTVAFYAACVDPRIRLAVVSCSFCPFADSWLALPARCACGYLPGIYALADMPDLAGLIAPRDLIVVAAAKDHLAPIAAVRQGAARAARIFQTAGSPENLQLLIGDGGHQFYPKLAWPVIQKVADGW